MLYLCGAAYVNHGKNGLNSLYQCVQTFEYLECLYTPMGLQSSFHSIVYCSSAHVVSTHIHMHCTQMSLCITGNQLLQGSLEIYSVTERPVPDPPSPTDQIVITVVANSTFSREGIVQDLWDQLNTLSAKFGCDFVDLVRFGKS